MTSTADVPRIKPTPRPYRFVCEPLEVRRHFATGVPDTTFGGGDGLAAWPDQFSGNRAAVAADGAVLVAGTYYRDLGDADGNGVPEVDGEFAVVRYRPDGTLDSAFGGGDGIASIDLDTGYEIPTHLMLLPDGKILVAGDVTAALPPGIHLSAPDPHLGLARFLPDGTPDPTFGDGGQREVPDVTATHWVSVDVAPDGTILAAGNHSSYPSVSTDIVRLHADGTIDATPVFNAVYTTTLEVRALADGEFVASLLLNGRPTIIRYGPDGSLRAQYGADGSGETGFTPRLAPLPDGRLLVGGRTSSATQPARYDFRLIRYLPNGSADPAFGFAGVVVTDFAGPLVGGATSDVVADLAPLPDGRFIAYGAAGAYRALVAYNADGTPDTTFGDGGKAVLGGTLHVDAGGVQTDQLLVQPGTGRLLLTGRSASGVESIRVIAGPGPTNFPPVVTDDAVVAFPGMAVPIGALANDADLDGGVLSIVSVGPASGGSAVVADDGAIRYTPAPGFVGVDRFTYTAGDDRGGTTVGNVTVNVEGAATAPDPQRPGRTMLVVGGTGEGNLIFLRRAPRGAVRVEIDSVVRTFPPVPTTPRGGSRARIGRVVVGAGAGDDVVSVERLNVPLTLFGGEGNDVLVGGGRGDVLAGGAGNDTLVGAGGDDLLVGGAGADLLRGLAGSDILVAGSTVFDGGGSADRPAMDDILARWADTRGAPKSRFRAFNAPPAAEDPPFAYPTARDDRVADTLDLDRGDVSYGVLFATGLNPGEPDVFNRTTRTTLAHPTGLLVNPD